MKYFLTDKTYCSNQQSLIEKHGDRFWELLCDSFPADGRFTVADFARVIRDEFGYAKPTAHNYAKAILENCARMPEGGVFPAGPRLYRFHDVNGL